MKKITLLIIAGLFSYASAQAEEITLKSGKVIKGNILEVNRTYIKVDMFGITLPYWIDEIYTIDGQELSRWRPAKRFWRGSGLAEEFKKTSEYINREYGFQLKFPLNWQILSKDVNTQYFEWLKAMMPASPNSKVACFVSEDLPHLSAGQSKAYNPLPLVTIARQVTSMEGEGSQEAAESSIARMVALHKQRAEEERISGNQPAGIGTAILRNALGEEIVRYPKLEPSGIPGENKKILYVTYLYSHFDRSRSKLLTLVLISGCSEEDAPYYLPAFDEIAKSLTPAEIPVSSDKQ